ncbi:MAG: FCD domain-containing protein [Propionibacteriaceae bacterium]
MSLQSTVVDALGQEIVSGQLAVGQVLSADLVCQRFDVSRPIARESLRELESLGLVRARPQVGTTVLASPSWNLFHPRLIGWRGRHEFDEQLREVLEMRSGLEPVAAGLAAGRIGDEDLVLLKAAWEGMRDAASRDDSPAYVEHDADFHRVIYATSRNALIGQFSAIVAAVFQTRLHGPTSPINPQTQQSLDLHGRLYRAIAARRPDQAERAARLIITASMAEFDVDDPPRR